MASGGNALANDYDFVLYFDITEPVDKVDLPFNCLCVRWATEQEVNHSTGFIRF